MELANGYERLSRNYSLLTDQYQITMTNGYMNLGKKDQDAVFDVFFRKIPSDGGYAVMAGLDKIIEYIKAIKFEERELDYFRSAGCSEEYIEYMRNFKFTGSIYAIPDGTPVFPNEPIITVKAPLIQAQYIETALLSAVNGAMEHATGARRIIEAVPKNTDVIVMPNLNERPGVMEFGARRADGFEAAIDSSIYGIMAGCVGTSNALAAHMLGIKAMGTQAHSWIQSFDTEYESFLAYAKTYPNNCTLLVDTYDTLKSGVPNAIKVFKYMRDNGIPTDHIGIRIDSGDLASTSKKARKMMDDAGFKNAKIILSNGLNAATIESLITQGACFDALGIGDNISKPEGRMGCVYKEVELDEVSKIKLSGTVEKITNPGYKKLYRAFDKNTGSALADVIAIHNQELSTNKLILYNTTNTLDKIMIKDFELVELQKPIFVDGKLVYNDPSIYEKQAYCEEQMSKINFETKRIEMPEPHQVSGTEEFMDLKKGLILELKQAV